MACARVSSEDEASSGTDDAMQPPCAHCTRPKLRTQTQPPPTTSTHISPEENTFKRRSRTLPFRRKKGAVCSKETSLPQATQDPKKHKVPGNFWSFRLKKKLAKKKKDHGLPEPSKTSDSTVCVCTGYRRTDEHVLGAGVVFSSSMNSEQVLGLPSVLSHSMSSMGASAHGNGPILSWALGPPNHGRVFSHTVIPAPAGCPLPSFVDLSRFNPEDFPCEDIDELMIAQRRTEMERGVELAERTSPVAAGSRSSHAAYPNVRLPQSRSPSPDTAATIWQLSGAFQGQCVVTTTTYPLGSVGENGAGAVIMGADAGIDDDDSRVMDCRSVSYVPAAGVATVHTQVDYIHCMVPDLARITSCGFYWGVMDRYEAERLLDNRPEGTFLLRDSAQDDFLFSVSFRRYGRSLHARIEQWNHNFSFDSHDPGVFASRTVFGLIEHYKDPSCCMFFEPMLTLPLHRNFAFSLQHLCRSKICDQVTYDSVTRLPLPKMMRQYLQYYHYKQKIRVRKFDCQHQPC